MWNDIRTYILDPKFKEVCCNIAKRSGLHDDLYQELMLTLLEKIHAQKQPLLIAWQGKYIDWYIVSTADRIFHSSHGTIRDMRDTSTGTGGISDADGVVRLLETNPEITFDELAYSHYNYSKFYSNSTGSVAVSQYIEAETEKEFEEMVTLCETQLGKEYWYNARLFAQYVFQDSSIRKIEKKTGIPRNSIHRTLKETRERLRLVCGEKLKRMAV